MQILGKPPFLKGLSHVLQQESTLIRKQQFYVLIYYVCMMLISISVNLFGLSGPGESVNVVLNATYFALTVSFFVVYLCHWLRLETTLTSMLILTQLSTSIEMIFCAFSPTPYNTMLIIANMVLLTVNLMLSLLVYLKWVNYLLGSLTLLTYFACSLITGDESLINFLGVYIVVLTTATFLGSRLVDNVKLLTQENSSLREDEEAILAILALDREEAKAYAKLAKSSLDSDQTHRLLENLRPDTRRNVIENVRQHLLAREVTMADLDRLFPELSPTERQICELIMQGKKQSEICLVLDKTESNVNSTRAHIRKKLNLSPTDNLMDALHRRRERGK